MIMNCSQPLARAEAVPCHVTVNRVALRVSPVDKISLYIYVKAFFQLIFLRPSLHGYYFSGGCNYNYYNHYHYYYQYYYIP